MHKLLGRPGLSTDHFVLFHKVNLNVEFVYGSVILEIPVQAVGFLHQDRAAHARMLLEVDQHLAEFSSAALLGRFDIGQLVGNRKPFARSVLAQEAKLRRDAETVLLLVLARHPRVQPNFDGARRRPVFGGWRHG